ncbi:hypothetical protein QVD17_27636 [Tagetes erecta]|uniref:Transmembrane protein n=1 Tax=Tagetes erecta TaxID=13708 RepID=A0AAD8KBS8_TARER|nr:hypothetical protein QVD17_27636 [Tagetes erecta]
MSSSFFASNGLVLATAMIAVSSTVIFLTFRHQKQPATAITTATNFPTIHHPRPCIYIDGKKRVKKKKKVRFAEDVMEPSGSGDEFRKRVRNKNLHKWRTSSSLCKDEGGKRKITITSILRYT